METLTKETFPSSTILDTKTELTDEQIYGSEVPQTVLNARKFEQERGEENLGRHAENIVYSTEIVDFADTLLNGEDSFTHSEGRTRGGLESFSFGSFEVKRTTISEGSQDYAISMIQMGSREPKRVDCMVSIRNGQIRVSTRHESGPSRGNKPQALDPNLSWNSDQLMDPNDLTKGGERETGRQLAAILSFIEQHSERERR